MTQHAHRADAVGAYRDPHAHRGRSIMPWVLGLILLLLAILAIAWAMGAFRNDAADRPVVSNQGDVPAARTAGASGN